MPRTEQVITVFVASPGDVAEERARLEHAIAELNRTWSKALGVRIELVRWETHAYPGVGVDAQDVINQEIPTDYDIFIGIMWCRYGTPTKRAGSGTEEEFRRAKEKYDSNPGSMKLMMYFKNAPIAPRDINPTQLAAVDTFREALGEQGVLWWQFNDADEFEKHIRFHLSRQIQAWKETLGTPSPSPPAGATETVEAPVDREELGLFDLMEIYEARMRELTDITNRIGEATEEIGQKVLERTEEINQLPRDSNGVPNRGKAKKVIAKTASDMDQYARRVGAELPLFTAALDEGMDRLLRVLELSAEFKMREKREDIEEALSQVRNLQSSIGSSSGSIRSFRDSIAGLPPLTYEMNSSKRRVVDVLDALLGALSKGESLLHEAELAFRKFLDRGPSS
jgi:hypothetical protein